MRSIITLIALFFSSLSFGQNIIPMPKTYTELSTNQVKASTAKSSITKKLAQEQYTIRIKGNSIKIEAGSDQALVWANATLAQLKTENNTYPEVFIDDYPSFDFRAFMYDSGRNFIEIDMVKQYIDLISKYKLNVFHWHLTDNPAWRIESKIYPQLNDAKYQRKGRDEGKFYTYDQIRDVIAYAKQRGIMVVPEIDMPGHSKFFTDTFGFTMDSKEGMAVLEKCLDEFFNEIPVSDCPYFHIGSDEVHIKDPKGFMAWSESIAKKYNRQAIAWDPGLPSSETTIRQIWNEAEGANSAAVKKGGKYVDSFMGYLNYYDPILQTNRIFLHKACGVEKGDERAIGGILCLWNDVRVGDKSKLLTHNGVLNGVMAFSERFWVGGDVKHEGTINLMPDPKSEAGVALSAFEKRLLWHKQNMVKSDDMRWMPNSTTKWSISEPTVMGIDTTNLKWNTAWGGVIDVYAFSKKYGFDAKTADSMNIFAKTTIFANCDTTIHAWVGFEVSARSNRKGNGIGEQGQWECNGKLYVNGKEIAPQYAWNEPGKYNYKFHTWHKPQEEEPYTDEQLYYMREPLKIQLKKGDNTIEITSPKRFKNQRWTFAFISF